MTGDYTSPLGALVETECGWLAQSGIEVKKVVEELAQQSTADWEDDLTP